MSSSFSCLSLAWTSSSAIAATSSPAGAAWAAARPSRASAGSPEVGTRSAVGSTGAGALRFGVLVGVGLNWEADDDDLADEADGDGEPGLTVRRCS